MTNPSYDERLKRFNDAVALKGPDRIPVIPINVHYFDTNNAGISNQDAMQKVEIRYKIWKEFVFQYGFDMAPVIGTFPSQLLEILGAKHYKWPGGALSANFPFQYVEQEYMLQDEYDSFLSNPADFTCRVLWPRKAQTLEPFHNLPPIHWMGMDPLSLGPFMTDPKLVDSFKSLIELGEVWQHWMEFDRTYSKDVEEEGFPLTYVVANGHTAFDVLADYYRGLRGIMLDMYQVPDKLLAAIDLFTHMLLESLITEARLSGNPRVPLWLHRGQDQLMSPEQYEKFYWPSLQKLILGLVEAQLTPIPYFQGDNTLRLPYMKELPKGKAPIHFDIVDRKQARKIIGGHQCFWGNIPASVMVTGTADQVKDDIKQLIDTFGDTGGLIIDASSAIPDEAKPENVTAMLEAVFDYGLGG